MSLTFSLQAVNIESIHSSCDCTYSPRIGHFTELLLERHNDISSTYVNTKKLAVTQVVFSKNASHMYTNVLQMRQLPPSAALAACDRLTCTVQLCTNTSHSAVSGQTVPICCAQCGCERHFLLCWDEHLNEMNNSMLFSTCFQTMPCVPPCDHKPLLSTLL